MLYHARDLSFDNLTGQFDEAYLREKISAHKNTQTPTFAPSWTILTCWRRSLYFLPQTGQGDRNWARLHNNIENVGAMVTNRAKHSHLVMHIGDVPLQVSL